MANRDAAAPESTRRRAGAPSTDEDFRPSHAPGLGLYAAAAPAALLLLLLIGAVLHVPGGWGIEDFLGWPDTRRNAAAHQMLRLWSRSNRIELAWLYLALDSVLFVPLYVIGLAGLAQRLAQALGDDVAQARSKEREGLALVLLLLPVLALMAVDLLENAIGLSRLGTVGTALAVIATLVGIGLALWSSTLSAPISRISGGGAAVLLFVTVAVVGINGFLGTQCAVPAGRATEWITTVGCGAHAAKPWLALVVAVVLGGATLMWLTGAAVGADAPPTRRAERARLRGSVREVLLRSRYVLLVLALLGAGLLALDVGRDTLYAMAASPYRGDGASLQERLLRMLGTMVAFGLTALALWALAFTTWLWARAACQLRRPHSPAPSVQGAVPGQGFARWWARALAGVPVVLVVLLCVQVLREGAAAQVTGPATPWLGPAILLLAFGVSVLTLGLVFLKHRHDGAELLYLDAWSWAEWATRAGVVRHAQPSAPLAKFRFMGWLHPQGLVALLLLALLLCRAMDLLPPPSDLWEQDRLPTLTLAVLLFSAALWMTLCGWLTLLEVGIAGPWAGLLALLAVLGLGALGWTANAAVWPAVESTPGLPGGGMRMLLFTALLGGLLLLAHVLALVLARQHAHPDGPMHPLATTLLSVPALGAAGLVLAMLVLVVGDRIASPRPAGHEDVLPAQQRPTLDQALSTWLSSLCEPVAGSGIAPAQGVPDAAEAAPAPVACRPALPLDAQGAMRVFLVAAEGEGMRGAAWTAFVLQQLGQHDPALQRRVFAITGVSGAAAGAAALRGCTLDGLVDAECLTRFARADLLSPLVSAGVFEEALALALPTSWCDTPGCGFLSRAAWFEQALEAAGPGLRPGLMESRRQLAFPGAGHLPYLLLEAAWVESGERAIASDLRIDWRQFPGARDQLGLVGQDLSLGTVAHNAARLPLLHPPGALRAPRGHCMDRRPGAAASAPDADAWLQTCGHLADGHQADPGGAQATVDLLQALAHCLSAQPSAADLALYPHCAAMDETRRAWLREHLLPQVLLIRAEVPPPALLQDQCPAPEPRPPSGAELAQRQQGTGCAAPAAQRVAQVPERPQCAAPAAAGWMASLRALSPADPRDGGAAALAEARQAQAVAALRASLGGLAALSAEAPVRTLDLSPDGTRHPTHWLLPALTVERMWKQARGCAGGDGG
ncbi:hypothetical protein [Azohydromonas australica]|uniref:hypothetical protein n=1 Tax=Azohydromonas australica TaxID=364039 RepID=UPI0003F7DE7C|nr:hypothetical protein [Azohydromonas australica]